MDDTVTGYRQRTRTGSLDIASASGQGNDALMMFSRASRVPRTEVGRRTRLDLTATDRYDKTA